MSWNANGFFFGNDVMEFPDEVLEERRVAVFCGLVSLMDREFIEDRLKAIALLL